MEEALVNDLQSTLQTAAVELYSLVDLDDELPDEGGDEEEEEEEEGGEEEQEEEGGEEGLRPRVGVREPGLMVSSRMTSTRPQQQGAAKAMRGSKGSTSAAAAKAASRHHSSSQEGFPLNVLKAAGRNWLLTLLALLCCVTFVVTFLDALQDAKAIVRAAGWI